MRNRMPTLDALVLISKKRIYANGRVAESNFCGTPLLQTNQEKNGGIASKSNQPKPKKV